jgi:hypothetical protein
MRRDIFGIPIWVFGVSLAGLALLVIYIRRRNQGTQVAGLEDVPDPSFVSSDPEDSIYGLPSGPIGSYLQGDPTNPAYPVGITPQGIPGPITNEQWARLALDQLLAKGDDPSLVSNALFKYLQGKQLSQGEQAVINLALQLLGAPPEGVQPVITSPVPAPSGGSGGGSSTGGGTTARPVLRLGSRGQAVKDAQAALNRHGAHLAVDGIFGPLTYGAVITFQRQQHIQVDGIIGPVTWSRLL